VGETWEQDQRSRDPHMETRPGPAEKASKDRERDDAAKPAEAPARGRSWIARHKLWTALIVIVALAAAAAGVLWWLNARHYEDTDDAFIDARPSAISAQVVSAAIVEVPVTDNEIVEAGQPLVQLDDRDYRAALAQAEAQIAQAEAAMGQAEAQMAAQQSAVEQVSLQVTEAQAALTYSQDENERAQDLLKKGAGTLQAAQQTNADLIQKRAALDAAQAALIQAKRQLAVFAAQRRSAEAQRAAAEAQRSQAEANLSRTVIVAPFRGRVTELTAARGAYATPGQTLMLIVPLDVWVTANFRETQLADMHPGQPATLCVDAYSKCFPGHVDSIQAGSGTAFSLLPAENATGNYVKIVQRVPVKLVFDRLPDLELGPGMSVTPSVKVR
jgi:membrane fusion protein, multidrug efflux system